MAELDLTEAIEAGVRAYFDEAGLHFDLIGRTTLAMARRCMGAAQTAAAPIIARQVREQVAAEIEAYRGEAPWVLGIPPHAEGVGHWVDSHDATLAARIARGGAS